MVENPVRKGDVVVVRETHSYVMINPPKRVESTLYRIAVVGSATREGIVKKVAPGPNTIPVEVWPSNVWSLSDHAASALRPHWGEYFDTLDEIKALVA